MLRSLLSSSRHQLKGAGHQVLTRCQQEIISADGKFHFPF